MKKLLGIEIGNKTLKMVEVNKEVIEKYAVVDLPENIIVNDQVVAFDALGDLIKQTMKDNKMNAKEAVMVLPDNTVNIKKLTLPNINIKQFSMNLFYEFRDVLTENKDNYLFDYVPIEAVKDENGNVKEILLFAVAIKKDIIFKYQKMLERANLKLENALPAEFAINGLFRILEDQGKEEDIAILDLGYTASKLFIYEKSIYEITRNIDTGLKQAIQNVASKTGTADYLASSYFEMNKDNIQEDPDSVAVYTSVATEVVRALNYYSFEKPDNKLNNVYYCGGGSFVERFVSEIKETLSVDFVPINDLFGIEEEDMRKFAAAYGMCIETNFRGPAKRIKDPMDKTYLDFIDHSMDTVTKYAFYGLAAFIPVFIIFIIIGILLPMRKLNRLEKEYNQIKSQVDDINVKLADFDEINEEYNLRVGSFLKDTELDLRDRKDIIDMVHEDVFHRLDISDFRIAHNTVTLVSGPSDMDTISDVVLTLLNDPRNSYVTVKTTSVKDKDVESIYANIVIQYSGEVENETVSN